MNFNELPEEIVLKIFDYANYWMISSLVCKQWKNLIEEFHVFHKSNYFLQQRNESERDLAINSIRKYRAIDLEFDEESFVNLDDLTTFVEYNSSLEKVKVTFHQAYWDEITVQLLKLFKNVVSLKIYNQTYMSNRKPKVAKHSAEKILYKNLKNLEVYHRDHNPILDNSLKAIEAPNIERFIFKSRSSRFSHMTFALHFINEHSTVKLKYFDVACYIHGFWLEFYWTGNILKIAECKDPIVRNQISLFVENNCHKFHQLQQLFIYRSDPGSDIPEKTINSLFLSAVNLEAISTDWKLPQYESKNVVYRNLKILKLWGLRDTSDDSKVVYYMSRSFPNVQKLIICESINENFTTLIPGSFQNLLTFKHGIEWDEYHDEYPPNEKYFDF